MPSTTRPYSTALSALTSTGRSRFPGQCRADDLQHSLRVERRLVVAEVQVKASARVHAEDQGRDVRFNRLGSGIRQVDLDALAQERRCHHEDDEQHEHHVDVRDDVDLAHELALTAG